MVPPRHQPHPQKKKPGIQLAAAPRSQGLHFLQDLLPAAREGEWGGKWGEKREMGLGGPGSAADPPRNCAGHRRRAIGADPTLQEFNLFNIFPGKEANK